jgi:ribosomal protein S18 acetylase RimI-like enzyme
MHIEKNERKSDIKISPAAPEDVRGMADVLYKTWLATYPDEKAGITKDDIEDRFKDSFTEESLKKRAEMISQLKENEASILAKIGGKIIGVCYVVRRPGKNELQAIYVLPEHQKKGIGKLLWKEAQKYFDADKDITVEVAVYNTNAIDFYKKLGFEKTGKEIFNEKFRMKSGAIIPETEMMIKAEKWRNDV